MESECSKSALEFQPLGSRRITARFGGGTITSDAGRLRLREVEAGSGLLAGFATCFDDHRDPELIEHTVEALLKQRVFALALGYEDLNDHDQLRADPPSWRPRRHSAIASFERLKARVDRAEALSTAYDRDPDADNLKRPSLIWICAGQRRPLDPIEIDSYACS